MGTDRSLGEGQERCAMRAIGAPNGHLEALCRAFWRVRGPWYSKYVLVSARSTIVASAEPPIAQYLNDLWLFDTQEYKWHQIEFGVNDRKPSYVQTVPVVAFAYLVNIWRPRSGFSFLPVPEGVILHGNCLPIDHKVGL